MAFFTVKKCLLVCVLVVAFIVEGQAAKSRKKARGRGFQNFGCAADNDVNKNITALWTHVKLLSQPIEVHVHEDLDHHDHSSHDHSNHSHSHHGHGKGHKSHKSHKHGHGHDHGHDHGHGHGHGHGHSHASHGHGSHGHGHHGDDHSFKDNHIHIHLSVNNKDDCPFVSYAPKDKFVYARCDMQREKGSGLNIKGSILMRQKPHGILETKMVLRGFKGPSPGIKDGKHDFFFDVHDYADFTDGCKSFGTHDHVHHEEGKFDHEHDHKHEHDDHHGHSHGHHDGHDHSVHDHHAHEDDWGNVIINNNGVSKMDVNCTHHELYGPESMFGRGIVLHDKDDKLISCCAITYANIDDEAWEKL